MHYVFSSYSSIYDFRIFLLSFSRTKYYRILLKKPVQHFIYTQGTTGKHITEFSCLYHYVFSFVTVHSQSPKLRNTRITHFSGYVSGHHAPNKTGKLSCSCCSCNVCIFASVVLKTVHPVLDSLFAFVRICYYVRTLPCLPLNKSG